MKIIFKLLIALAVLAGLSITAVLNIPALQDRLMAQVIEKRISATPSHLFNDDALRVVVCGSASPMPHKSRAAARVMVIAGGKYYIVDAGNRSTNNLNLCRIPAKKIGGVMITHFHSDHIGDLGELNMMSWVQGRGQPLPVYGPKGIEQVVGGFTESYAADRRYRIAHHGADVLSVPGANMRAVEIDVSNGPASVFEQDGLKVTMFPVEHQPIDPAVGYRFDYKGRSVVISGDTIKSAKVVAAAKGADVLMHEAQAMHMVKQLKTATAEHGDPKLSQLMHDILDYHTSPVEAAEVANEAGVAQLVLYHLTPAPPNKLAEKFFMRGVSDVRPNGTLLADDGLVITLPLNSKDILTSWLTTP